MLDPPQKKKSHRGFWIAFVVVVPLLSVAFGVYNGLLFVNRSTPEKTLNAFCNAMQRKDDLEAYGQYSSVYQRTYPEQQFGSDMSLDRVVSCSYDSISVSGSRAVTRMRLVYASGAANDNTVILRQDSDWKIDGGMNFSTPRRTLETFCLAMQRGDYPLAHDQFITQYQSGYSEQQFERDALLDKVTSCSFGPVSLSGSSALTNLVLVHASKAADDDPITLSQDGKDVWKIAHGINLSTPLTTMNAFCNAMQSGDYQTAYNQFSDQFQKTVSQQVFVAAFSRNKVSSCLHDSPAISGMSAMTMVKLVIASGLAFRDAVILVQDSSTGWKIDDVKLI